MKRVLLAVTGTVAGLVALLGYKSHGTALGLAGSLSSTGQAQASGSGSTPPSTQTTKPSTGTHTRHRTAHSSAAPAGPMASSGPSTSPSAVTHTVVGNAEQTPYGVVQVKVTGSKGKIANVSFVQLTAYDGTSQMINQQAAPILLQQTMKAQSAKIDGVSGASYTSMGYIQSLQSALDKL